MQAFDNTATARRPVPADPRGAILAGLAVILVGFGGFTAWAALAPIAGAVLAPGTIIVDTQRKEIQHLDGGIVKRVLVRDGDHVRQDQLLVHLDDTEPKASLSILQGEYDAARAREARLSAESRDADRIVFSDDLLARRAVPKIAEMLDGQRTLFAARRSSRSGQNAILKQRVEQLAKAIAGMEAQEASKRRQAELIQDELSGVRRLYDRGYAEKTRLRALEREAERLQGERGAHLADIARSRAAIGEANLQILQTAKDFQEKVLAELREVQARRFDLEQRLAAARAVLARVEVRAPVDGIVVGLKLHTESGVVRPGDTLLEIVPDADRLIVEARVQPTDIDQIALGQRTDIQMTAFRSRATPILVGGLTYVSADALTDERTDQPYYLVRVEVSEQEVARIRGRLHPGMPAQVMIKTDARTPLRYLTEPMTDYLRAAWREE